MCKYEFLICRIWNNCDEKEIVEGQERFYLIGDSPYPISPTMMKAFPGCFLTTFLAFSSAHRNYSAPKKKYVNLAKQDPGKARQNR